MGRTIAFQPCGSDCSATKPRSSSADAASLEIGLTHSSSTQVQLTAGATPTPGAHESCSTSMRIFGASAADWMAASVGEDSNVPRIWTVPLVAITRSWGVATMARPESKAEPGTTILSVSCAGVMAREA